ncbi:aminodeoxychorismate synthase component I [Legionella tunisiensis]|uniref:aminodeoxychorismate synthase component I n=1 Tax=Legionella tunisiensis TaxID=1034944 RepID=UPI0002D6291C
MNIFPLEYTDNLIENYQKMSKLPGFVLLESSDRVRGRYDILSAYPYEQFRIERHATNLSSTFEELQKRVPLIASSIDLPFQGGAIGYFSYDFAINLAGINSTTQPTLVDMPLVDMGLYDWAIIADHRLKKVSLFSANSRADTASIVEEIKILWQDRNQRCESFRWSGFFVPLLSQTEYQEAFKSIYQDLQQGRCYQVNYTQPFNACYEGDPWEMYKQIRLTNPVPYCAFMRTNKGDFLSFSPERFLTGEQGHLLTSPIKGTERRAANYCDDMLLRERLLASSKNRAENIMIVDLLRNDLGKIAQPGSVRVSALCEAESYQSVHHLVSHIEAQCRDGISSWQAIEACFPGGSITGAPKLESMYVIAEQEPYSRGIYCGSLGYFSRHGRFDSNIAIRTVTACKDVLHLAAGGGIVIDSNWEDEYRECFTKIAAIVNGLIK